MARGYVKIIADRKMVKWVKNFGELGAKVTPGAVKEWEAATEVMFGATQQYIHVDSGDLQGSGSIEIEDETRHTITAAISYGGGQRSNAKPHWKHQEIDYAKYELERGGSHDFFQRAANKTHKRLQQGVGDGLRRMVEEMDW